MKQRDHKVQACTVRQTETLAELGADEFVFCHQGQSKSLLPGGVRGKKYGGFIVRVNMADTSGNQVDS